jgi:hypothetical protein
MKLRLLDDSIRLRLSRDEAIAADERGIVEGRTRFPDGSVFTFALEALRNSSSASASYATDFECISPRDDEDQTNLFLNPATTC